MLVPQNLYSGIKEAFDKGISTNPSGTDDRTSVYTEDQVATFISNAIVDYAAEAQISFRPGPFIFKNPLFPPTPPPVLFDLRAPFMVGKPIGATNGRHIIRSAIVASFKAMDPTFAALTAALPIYAATFISYQSDMFDNAVGVTTMAKPPIFTKDLGSGMGGSSSDQVAMMMANTIHTAFLSCKFIGAATTVTILGFGPVVSSLY